MTTGPDELLIDLWSIEDWVTDAACSDAGPEMFYEPPFFRDNWDPTAALTLCHRCDVRPECLEHALRFEKEGIWGGTTPEAREQLRLSLGITVATRPIPDLAVPPPLSDEDPELDPSVDLPTGGTR